MSLAGPSPPLRLVVPGGAGHVIAEHRERVGERMAAAVIGQDAGYTDDHRRDQADEPDDYDVLRESEL
jgi:hypothetical protein